MEKVILVRYGEIHLKGKNRWMFDDMLLENMQHALKDFDVKIERVSGRYLVRGYKESKEKQVIARLQNVAGLYSVSPAIEFLHNEQTLKNVALDLCKDCQGTFKVETNRADKTYALTSMEVSRDVGGFILAKNKNVKVDIHKPQTVLHIDIRENGKTYVFFDVYHCVGGLPVGSAGKGLLLLSGGIDSPVAGYMMAKRGVKLAALHFHSYPYTSLQAKEKVLELAKVVAKYNGAMKVHIVSLTKIQEAIHEHCDPDFMITIMRRFMMRIAEYLCKKESYQMIVTGESLGQVASQTIESMTVIGEVIKDVPLLKPLVAFDKVDTIEISKKIGAFDISIQPYEDCCTVFLPKTPVTRPKLAKTLREENRLDVDALMQEALQTLELIEI